MARFRAAERALPASFESRIAHYTERVALKLDSVLPPVTKSPRQLHDAMRYAVFNGGKRVRPLLVYAAGESLDVPEHVLDAPAAAIELTARRYSFRRFSALTARLSFMLFSVSLGRRL